MDLRKQYQAQMFHKDLQKVKVYYLSNYFIINNNSKTKIDFIVFIQKFLVDSKL